MNKFSLADMVRLTKERNNDDRKKNAINYDIDYFNLHFDREIKSANRSKILISNEFLMKFWNSMFKN